MQNSSIYPFHLCQPDLHKSCGACCGLYNFEDHSRAALRLLLQKRTSLFRSLGKEFDIDRYRRLSETPASNPKLLEPIYDCEFLGFLDEEEKRIGCLLHPSLHSGKDLRDRSFYGIELCAGHFCPSYTYLTAAEQAAVLLALGDWYLYGLVITDIDLVKDFFRHVQEDLADHLHSDKFRNPGVQASLRSFFVLKEKWKFSSSKNRLGKYYFSHTEYQIARIEYKKNGK